MSLASLEAFLEQAHEDEGLRRQLITAPDAAAVAAIAQAAGFAVSELDLWQASAASPADLLPSTAGVLFDSEDVPSTTEEVPRSPGQALMSGGQPLSTRQDPLSPRRAPESSRGVLPDPWLESEDPLSRFLHQAQGDGALQQALATAPDAAAVAAIARAAGYPISELDLWRASAATPEELADALEPAPADEPPMGEPLLREPLPREALGEEPLGQEPLAKDSPLLESLGQEPLGQEPLGEEPPFLSSGEEALLAFLHQAQGDEGLQLALSTAPDVETVAAIAQAAGYPLSALDIWRASGGSHVDDLLPDEPDLSPLEAPLARFLLDAEHDPALQRALATAPDARSVAAIAQAAGYPISADDLWEASDALPEELLITELILFEVVEELPN
ncbi:MAG: Nif11-like leader peptide family natural product precursor [Cyanobacteriota bacterium]|jgi:predicted ribosomally synthesized peptide with nif11-like leader